MMQNRENFYFYWRFQKLRHKEIYNLNIRV